MDFMELQAGTNLTKQTFETGELAGRMNEP